jgi:hypothetical protein
MFHSESEDFKTKKKPINFDELGIDDEELNQIENKNEKLIETVEEPDKLKLDSSDLSLQLLNKLRNEFMTKYSKIKYLLIFDKSLPTPDVAYFMVNPIDNCSLLSKGFKFNFSPIRNLIFYRFINLDFIFYFY